MKVMRAYIEKRGVFKTLYVDKRGCRWAEKEQLRRCSGHEELGIEIIFANSPQGKAVSSVHSIPSKTDLRLNYAYTTSGYGEREPLFT